MHAFGVGGAAFGLATPYGGTANPANASYYRLAAVQEA